MDFLAVCLVLAMAKGRAGFELGTSEKKIGDLTWSESWRTMTRRERESNRRRLGFGRVGLNRRRWAGGAVGPALDEQARLFLTPFFDYTMGLKVSAIFFWRVFLNVAYVS